MKTIKFALSFSILIVSILYLSSCDTSKKVIKSVPAEKLTETYTIKATDTLTIKMSSNPSTGYRWYLSSKIKPKVIKYESDNYVANDKNMNIIGGGGTHYWKFSAKKTGEVYIWFEYKRVAEDKEDDVSKEKYYKIIVE